MGMFMKHARLIGEAARNIRSIKIGVIFGVIMDSQICARSGIRFGDLLRMLRKSPAHTTRLRGLMKNSFGHLRTFTGRKDAFRLSTQNIGSNHGEKRIHSKNTVTLSSAISELPLMITTGCTKTKAAYASFVGNLNSRLALVVVSAAYPSITATQVERFVTFYVAHATRASEISKMILRFLRKPLNTFAITHHRVFA
jgi:hypothetical protein